MSGGDQAHHRPAGIPADGAGELTASFFRCLHILDGTVVREASWSVPLERGDIRCFCVFRQHQQEGHGQKVASLTAELRDLRVELRRREKERRESERVWMGSREDWKMEETRLMDKLDRRDRLIEVG